MIVTSNAVMVCPARRTTVAGTEISVASLESSRTSMSCDGATVDMMVPANTRTPSVSLALNGRWTANRGRLVVMHGDRAGAGDIIRRRGADDHGFGTVQ